MPCKHNHTILLKIYRLKTELHVTVTAIIVEKEIQLNPNIITYRKCNKKHSGLGEIYLNFLKIGQSRHVYSINA